MKTDVARLNHDNSYLKSDVASIKQEKISLKTEINHYKADNVMLRGEWNFFSIQSNSISLENKQLKEDIFKSYLKLIEIGRT